MTTRFRPGPCNGRGIIELDTENPDLMPDTRKVFVGGIAVPRRFTTTFPVGDLCVRATIRIANSQAFVEQLELVGKQKPTNARLPGESDAETTRRQMADRRMTGRTIPITPDALRELANRLENEVAEGVLMWTPLHQLDDTDRRYVDKREQRSVKKALESSAARRRLTSEHLTEVAAVYRANPSLPRQSVAAFFGTNESTASKWIKAARDAGFLKAAPKPGVSGEANE